MKEEEKKIDIDFIKKCVDRAEGFEYRSSCVEIPNIYSIRIEQAIEGKCLSWNHMAYPFLLQKAIERVMEVTNYEISFIYNKREKLYYYQIRDFKSKKPTNLGSSIGQTIDQAKESALRYIYEQES